MKLLSGLLILSIIAGANAYGRQSGYVDMSSVSAELESSGAPGLKEIPGETAFEDLKISRAQEFIKTVFGDTDVVDKQRPAKSGGQDARR